jgi:predicted RNA polymerase sigma factor
MVDGPEAGLRTLDGVATDPRVSTSHRLDAVRAHLLERAGDHAAAAELFRRAAARTTSTAERNYLLMHAARLAEGRASAD